MYSLEDLEKLCLAYDKEKGIYPEHAYEGRAFYAFLLREAGKDRDMVDLEVAKIWRDAGLR